MAHLGVSVRDLLRTKEAQFKELGLDNEKVNPNGSGISLGHPVGGTGAILVT